MLILTSVDMRKVVRALGLKQMKMTCKVGIAKMYLKRYKSIFRTGMRILMKRGIFLPHPA
jgi:hypothetical protein